MGVLTTSSEKTKLLQKEKRSSEKKLHYPKSIFFIVSNEFCERFTYYGLRTILTLYLTKQLYYSEDTSTVIYHCFAMLAYFTPLLGAIIADSFLGKFRTILYLSIIYCCGCAILSFGAYPSDLRTMTITSLMGLLVIAFGTGGIKPCVSAFGGDQFKHGQEKQLERFFSIFYLSINLGSLVSTFLTPILREDVHCFGDESCYTLAFGVPAALMLVALILFICGKSYYTIHPPEGNIVLKVAKCICHAIGKKCTSSEKKKSHWLDYADDKFDKKLIGDIKILLHVLVLYIPLPLFWALFDQQGSRWTLQATRMNGKLNGVNIKADQMQVINPILIITFIPLFDYVVYPLLNKCRLLRKPLQRITTGGVLAGISFIIAGFVELSLEDSYPILPSIENSQLTIINNSPCNIKINGANIPLIPAFQTTVAPEIPLGNWSEWSFNPENCTATASKDFSFYSNSSIESMMITLQDDNLFILKTNDTKTKSKDGSPQVRLFYSIDPLEKCNVTFNVQGLGNIAGYDYDIDTESEAKFGMTNYFKVYPGRYRIYLWCNETKRFETPVIVEDFKPGGIYIVHIYDRFAENVTSIYRMVDGNVVSILFQIPQYILITAGEIMFSITGLQFSYSQSPNSMKSVVQAAWLLTVAFGNLIVTVIAELALFEKQSHELFLFASLMIVDMAIFAILAYFYKYVTIKTPSEEEVEIESKESGNESQARSNKAYDEDKF